MFATPRPEPDLPTLALATPDRPPAALTSRHVVLRPVAPHDAPYLYALATSGVGYRWRFRGAIPPIESFAAALNHDVLVQFVAESAITGRPLGHVAAFDADLHSRHASIGAIFDGALLRSGIGVEGVALVADYPRALTKLFTVEGVLTEHQYFGGKYWDMLVMALTRESWEVHGRPMLDRVRD
jgi:RimJ/RimL family protein N-acetyltransferase